MATNTLDLSQNLSTYLRNVPYKSYDELEADLIDQLVAFRAQRQVSEADWQGDLLIVLKGCIPRPWGEGIEMEKRVYAHVTWHQNYDLKNLRGSAPYETLASLPFQKIQNRWRDEISKIKREGDALLGFRSGKTKAGPVDRLKDQPKKITADVKSGIKVADAALIHTILIAPVEHVIAGSTGEIKVYELTASKPTTKIPLLGNAEESGNDVSPLHVSSIDPPPSISAPTIPQSITPSMPETPLAQPAPIKTRRSTPSVASNTTETLGAPTRSNKFRQGSCQAITYLSQAHMICGTEIGFFISRTEFTRLATLGSQSVILFEVSDKYPEDGKEKEVDIGSQEPTVTGPSGTSTEASSPPVLSRLPQKPTTLREFSDRSSTLCQYLPFDLLDTDPTVLVNKPAFRVLVDHFRSGYEFLANRPCNQVLNRTAGETVLDAAHSLGRPLSLDVWNSEDSRAQHLAWLQLAKGAHPDHYHSWWVKAKTEILSRDLVGDENLDQEVAVEKYVEAFQHRKRKAEENLEKKTKRSAQAPIAGDNGKGDDDEGDGDVGGDGGMGRDGGEGGGGSGSRGSGSGGAAGGRSTSGGSKAALAYFVQRLANCGAGEDGRSSPMNHSESDDDCSEEDSSPVNPSHLVTPPRPDERTRNGALEYGNGASAAAADALTSQWVSSLHQSPPRNAPEVFPRSGSPLTPPHSGDADRGSFRLQQAAAPASLPIPYTSPASLPKFAHQFETLGDDVDDVSYVDSDSGIEDEDETVERLITAFDGSGWTVKLISSKEMDRVMKEIVAGPVV